MAFPLSNTPDAAVVFTSRDDNAYGAPMMGVPGETDSDGIPTDHRANPALWIYFVTSPVTVHGYSKE